MNDEFFEIEMKGAKAGINPMFGEWRKRFDFEPVSYSAGSTKRKEFKERIRKQLDNNFYYTNEVKVVITLYLEEQKVLETPAYGDLDNYAKTIFDALKGNGGLLIDDCQIQSLDISWIDIPEGTYFEIEVRGSPDDFIQSSLFLYEMADGLYYPQANHAWTLEGITELSELNKFAGLLTLYHMTKTKRSIRHSLRQEGLPQFRAFQGSNYLSPVLMGFHRTRIAESGFDSIERREWLAKYEAWKSDLGKQDLDKIAELERLIGM